MVRRGRDKIGKSGSAPFVVSTTAAGFHSTATSVKSACCSGIQDPVAEPRQETTAELTCSRTDLPREMAAAECTAVPSASGGSASTELPCPSQSQAGRDTGSGTSDDEDAINAFDAALALCAEEGSEVPLTALRALFSGAVQRASEARSRRDATDKRCNEVAAENQAVATELATRRAASSRAQVSKLSMEVKCREQAQLNQVATRNAKETAAEEEARNAELQEKFENAVPSIKEKLEVEATRRKKQREDIEALRNKLDNFAEQTKLSAESFAAQLKPGALRIEIAKAKCDQQEAERRAGDARSDTLRVELQRAKASHTKMKADATERERCLSKIQNILNDRKKTAIDLKAKTEQLVDEQSSLEAEMPILRDAAESEKTLRGLQKVVDRLQGICSQLEPDVKTKRLELSSLQARSEGDNGVLAV